MTTATRSDLQAPGGSDFEQLRRRFAGTIILPEDEAYDEARKVQHRGYDRYPAAIAVAANAIDVANAVRFGRTHGYQLAVRSGGHSLGGQSVADGALVIDLSALKAISIDPEKRTARVQSGARSGDLCAAAAPYGLALSTGDTASVGLGGLTLGGGIGWMVRKHGLAIDNLLSVEMVTAEGRILRANATDHAELFWGLRGGGGNFGIVTEFEFRLAPVPAIVGGAIVLPATAEVIRGYLDYAPNAPEDLTTIAQVMHAPPAPFIPAELVGKTVFLVMPVFTGDPADADGALAPIRALGEVLVEVVQPMPYPAIFQFTAEAEQPLLNAVRMAFTDDISEEQVQGLIDAVENAPSPISMVQLRGLGGAYARVPASGTAFAHRERRIMASVIGIWLDPEEDREVHASWADAAYEYLRPAANGAYSNFLGNDRRDRIREAYPQETYERLAALKRRYDPDNVFSLNQNIRPR